MRFKLPGEGRTWARYISELLIVAIGVALGLWATEWNSTRRTKADVQDARAALSRELTWNYESVRFRHQVRPCINRRLIELNEWIARQRVGGNDPLPMEFGRPGSRITRTSVWDVTKAGEVASKIPLDDRLHYAEAYDYIDNFSRLQGIERDLWYDIGDFAGASDLAAAELRQLQGLVSRATAHDESLARNYPIIGQHLAKMGVNIHSPVPAAQPARKRFCQPLTPR